MEINEYQVSVPGEDLPITIGLNIQNKFGMTHVNIFSVTENDGARPSNFLPRIAYMIAADILRGKSIEEINWSFVTGNQVSSINFSTTAGVPSRMDLSNRYAIDFDQEAYNGPVHLKDEMIWSIEKYSNSFQGVTPSYVKDGRVRRRNFDTSPQAVFHVPVDHPHSSDGFFYCKPPYIDAPHMADDYDFVLVDTQKVLARLLQDDPEMLAHADYKFNEDRIEDYLSRNSIDNPIDMGHWSFGENRGGLGLTSGQAAVIRLAAELDLPYFPVTVSKEDTLGLVEAVGYSHQKGHPFTFNGLNI